MKGLDELITHIDPDRELLIQAHDFPDHDAVACAYALGQLLHTRGFENRLCYGGTIQSNSLDQTVKLLEIPITAISDMSINENSQLIVVDGFVGSKIVTGLSVDVIGVIDHHEPPEEPTAPYFDIRPEYGSCSTIVYQYYKMVEAEISRNTSTMLLMGIMMDTAFMTRGVAPVDLEAFSDLFFQGDWETGSRLLRNSLSLNDLAVFREAINSCVVADDFCFVPVQKECTPEVMALVADFFLGLREIHFVVVLEPDRDAYRLSVRSEDNARPADVVIRRALAGIGSGGGHVHMGGGSIPRDLFPGEQGLRNRFLRAMGREV